MTTTQQLTGAEEVAWDLSDLYAGPDDPAIQAEMDEAKRATQAFRERYYGKVGELDAAGLLEAVVERERIESLVDRAQTFSQLHFALAKQQDADREVRRAAAEAITAALEPGLRTRTFVFNSILLDKSIDDRLRNYPTWISSRNLGNEVSDEAVQALVDAVVSRYDVPQRYYRLKARLLGLDRLAFYDRVAPFSDETRFTSWQEARRMVVDAYTSFAPQAGEIVD